MNLSSDRAAMMIFDRVAMATLARINHLALSLSARNPVTSMRSRPRLKAEKM